ncbi:hypothetical protein ABIB25_003471 [Nakamurella sp. UYEF19]
MSVLGAGRSLFLSTHVPHQSLSATSQNVAFCDDGPCDDRRQHGAGPDILNLSYVNTIQSAASAAGGVPVFTPYAITNRDCNS